MKTFKEYIVETKKVLDVKSITNLIKALKHAQKIESGFSSNDFAKWETKENGESGKLANWKKDSRIILNDDIISVGFCYDDRDLGEDDCWFDVDISTLTGKIETMGYGV